MVHAAEEFLGIKDLRAEDIHEMLKVNADGGCQGNDYCSFYGDPLITMEPSLLMAKNLKDVYQYQKHDLISYARKKP